MDKIYSRKRIRLPCIRKNGKKPFRNKLAFDVISILIIAIVTLVFTIKSITPIIDRVCENAAKAKATIISNNMATEVMKNYKYEDFIKIYKDANGNITMLQSNIITINEVTSSVATKIQEELINSEDSIVNVKLRKLFRSKDIIRYWTRYKDKIFRHRNSRN